MRTPYSASAPVRLVLLAAWVAILGSLALFATSSAGAAEARPHPHNGVLEPYSGPPPAVSLDGSEQSLLEQGEPVYKRVDTMEGDRGVAVFRVAAPATVVWSVIADFASYPAWIERVAETETYETDGDEIFVRFRLKHWLGDIEYYVHHSYPGKRLGWGTWKLDYRHRSDLDDTVGFWRVDPVADRPQYSDVTYAAEIRFKRWLPSAINKAISKDGLETATAWVKTQSELRAPRP